MLESQTEANPASADFPPLLVELPSWPRIFFGNLRDLILPRNLPRLELMSAPAQFWPDVFVRRELPWGRFAGSIALHVLAFGVLVAASRFLALRPQVERLAFDPHEQVSVYEPSDLSPLDTRVPAKSRTAAPAEKTEPADPELSKREVISLPPEADNRRQTIVTPPNVKLLHDVAMNNVIRWSDAEKMPQLEIPPVPLTPAAEIRRIAPGMQSGVVAPPPDVKASARSFAALQPSVIAPAPNVDSTTPRRRGDLDVGRSSVIAPAPQLAVEPQRAPRGITGGPQIGAPQVVAPPPTLAGGAAGSTGSRGRIVALNLHPVVGEPPAMPAGNRRGTFATSPSGHSGASGSPAVTAGSALSSGRQGGALAKNNLPSGLFVGGNLGGAGSPALHASSEQASSREERAKLSDAERSVFGDRKFYSVTLNMPNLNSAGGSWVVRFAELNPSLEPAGRTSDAAPEKKLGNLSQPAAIRKVDPGYPTQLMRQNVAGTVIVYAVIQVDGSVGDVRVLRGVESRIDYYASQAVSKWQFQPAMKNGAPVAVEATFVIPFHPQQPGSSF
jgi:TonB family protein